MSTDYKGDGNGSLSNNEIKRLTRNAIHKAIQSPTYTLLQFGNELCFLQSNISELAFLSRDERRAEPFEPERRWPVKLEVPCKALAFQCQSPLPLDHPNLDQRQQKWPLEPF